MDIKKYIKNIIKTCNNCDISDVEIYYSYSGSTVVNVANNEVETFNLSHNEGISVSGNYEGKNSITYIEKFDESSLADAISNIKATAPYNNKIKKYVQKTGISLNNDGMQYNADINSVIDKLKAACEKIKKADSRIISVPSCRYYENNTKIMLFDDKGAQLEDRYSYTVGSISVIAQENDIKKDGQSFEIRKNFEDIDYDKISSDAIYEAISMINAAPIKSGSYDVIIKNSAAANMFATFMTVFGADAIKKNTSKFKDKINTEVAAEALNIIEDPMYKNGKINRSFDDEGIKTYKKPLIENGILKNVLKTSEYEESTGNAFRNSYRENISVSALSCYIQAGIKSTEDIAKELKECVMITSIDGLHAGMNAVTGDFSLIANGYYMENGENKKPVNQITIAGNFYDLLKNIAAISNDTCTSDAYINFFESPSLLVKGLMIGGL